jgi:hypothetical protein
MRYAPGKKNGKQNNLNPWQQYKPRDLKRIAKICYGFICLQVSESKSLPSAGF